MYILMFTFIGSLLRSHAVSSTIFCIVEKTLHLLYPFSGVHLGTRPLENRKQVEKLSGIYKMWASRITSLGLLRSVLLLTESLLLVGDESTIFQGV